MGIQVGNTGREFLVILWGLTKKEHTFDDRDAVTHLAKREWFVGLHSTLLTVLACPDSTSSSAPV